MDEEAPSRWGQYVFAAVLGAVIVFLNLYTLEHVAIDGEINKLNTMLEVLRTNAPGDRVEIQHYEGVMQRLQRRNMLDSLANYGLICVSIGGLLGAGGLKVWYALDSRDNESED